ncbi:MAG: sigma-54-dependent Fis family transcriptional regulator [Sulfuricella sp.]|nr:sigma-54-dependent Fis family transcriptional regulator [Sulfuricella sp.]
MDKKSVHALIGNSPTFRQLLNTTQLVAATRASVLITGESGCGKENLARYLHAHSPLAQRPFIAVNCANLPENLVESELFGHRRGAFSNALNDRDGLVRSAHNGTLFLDEIGELPVTAQAKLLRFLENGEILPLGCDRPVQVNVRVIAATNCDLEQMVKAGRFRADLFYRLQVVPMEVPPLRERAADITELVEHFVADAAHKHGLPRIEFAPEALRVMRAYAWPGNVRELRNLCERLTILCQGQREPLGAAHLPLDLRAGEIQTRKATSMSLEQNERDMILHALEQNKGNRTHAAKTLGITRYTLLYRIKKHFPNEIGLPKAELAY